jgi:hypothetical protein
MASRTRKSKAYKMAFLLDETALRRLVDTIREIVARDEERAEQPELENFRPSNEISYIVTFSDGSSLECDAFEELVSLPNSRNRMINSISLASPERGQTHIELSFRTNDPDETVYYDVTGTEKDVFFFSHQIEERLTALRQWYSWIATAGPISLVILIVVSFTWLFIALETFQKPLGLQDGWDTPTEMLLFPVVMIFALAIMFGPVWLVIILRNRLFPVGVFALGEGVARYKRLQSIHKVAAGIIFGTIGLGLLIGYVTETLF